MPPVQQSTCPECGASLSPLASGWLCLRCFMRAGLDLDEQVPSERHHETASDHDALLGARFFGDYELLEEIARGGMGVVYKARQLGLDRLVALKFLATGARSSRDFIYRFQNEAAAAARLDHPHIVPIYEFGEHDGQYFLAMKFIDGPTLASQLAVENAEKAAGKKHPDPKRVAELLVKIAEAVHYAHQRGVLHRDLKPGNILLDDHRKPYVTDFGLAKIEERDSDLTLTQAVIGTASYMSPEQAAGGAKQLTIAADIYSLGAILYELLTGQPPFHGSSSIDILRQVVEQDASPPRFLNPSVDPDLETICLKCLEKDPARRYRTSQELADDLNRFLRDEPILARPVGLVPKTLRWCRRKPALATSLSLILILLLIVIIGSPIALYRISKAREAERRENYYASIGLADSYIKQGSVDRALALLTNCPSQYRHWEWGRLMYLCHQEISSFSAVTERFDTIIHLNYRRVVANSDHTRMATVGESGVANVWNVQTGAKLFSVGGPTNRIVEMAFAPNGEHIAFAEMNGRVELWDAASRHRLFLFTNHQAPIVSIMFATNAGLVTAATVKSACAWDTRTGQTLLISPSLPGRFATLVLHPDTLQIGTLSTNKVQIWDAKTGKLKRTVNGKFDPEGRLFFSPDGTKILTANLSQGPSIVWNTETGEKISELPRRVHEAAFNADGSRIATLSGDAIVRVWNAHDGHEVLSLNGHTRTVQFITYSPDFREIITVSEDGVVKVWRADLGRESLSAGSLVEGVAIAPDGQRIALGQDDAQVTLWEIKNGRKAKSLRGHFRRVRSLAYSGDGKRLATASWDKTAMVWDEKTGRKEHTLRGHSGNVMAIAFSHDGKHIATASRDRTAKIWNAQTGSETKTLEGHAHSVLCAAFSPDGTRLVTGSMDQSAIIWDVETGRRLHTLNGHTERVLSVAYSPNGRILATTGFDRMIHLWDPLSGKRLRSLQGHLKLYSLSFSPDGKRLITASGEHNNTSGYPTAEIWDLDTGRELLSLHTHSSPMSMAVFSPDGRRIATAHWDGVVQLLETFPWHEKDYPGSIQLSLLERVRTYADNYWKERQAEQTLSSDREVVADDAGLTQINRSEFQPRDNGAAPNLIDLTERYNGLLQVSWMPMWSIHLIEADLASLPRGIIRFGEVQFDTRGVVQLGSAHPGYQDDLFRFPTRVNGIGIGRKFKRLHAFHGGLGKDADGTPVGSYLLHYADGSTRELDIIYGIHLRDWWTGEDPGQISKGAVVWTGKNSITQSLGGDIRLFVTTWENPLPNVEVTGIDYLSKMTGCGPFMIALTVE